jgi:hypothetical protein
MNQLVAAIAGMAILKGFVEPFSRQVFRRGVDRLLRCLPAAYDMLDPLWPAMEETLSPDELEQVVRETFASLTGEDWSRASTRAQIIAVDEFFQRHDARIVARKRIEALQ